MGLFERDGRIKRTTQKVFMKGEKVESLRNDRNANIANLKTKAIMMEQKNCKPSTQKRQ